MAKQTLDQWIHEALVDTEKEGRCTCLALIHMIGVREQEIHSLKLGDRQWEPKKLADIFRNKAENHAAELPGVQTFNMLAFYGDRNEPQARKPFMIHGENELGGLSTEGPDQRGMLQQMMRHNEAIIQMSFRQTAMLFENTNHTMIAMGIENRNLRQENREAFEIVRDMMIKQASDRNESTMKQLEYSRKTEERKKWLSFGPALVNGLLNREVFPQAMADSSLIETIVDSLSEEDIVKLGATGVIKPEVWGPLAQRMGQSLEKRRLLAEQREMIMNGNGIDPEDDAAGGTEH